MSIVSSSLFTVGVGKRRFIWLWSALSLLFGVTGCVGQTANVRALREYEREKVTPELVNEHLRELTQTLGQINTVVNNTPYRRGDRWVRDLALTEEYANRAKSALKNGPESEVRPTLLRLYSDHVADALKEAETLAGPVAAPTVAAIGSAVIPATPPALAPSDATAAPPAEPAPPPPGDPLDALHPSILEALSQVNKALPNMQEALEKQKQLALQIQQNQSALDAAKSSGAAPEQIQQSQSNVKALQAALEQQRAELKRQLEQNTINDPRAQQVIKEALTVTSVALRLAMEAATMASMVGLEIASFTHPKDLLHAAPELLSHVQQTAAQVKELEHQSRAAINGLKQLVDSLAQLNKLEPSDLPGFLYRDSLVDELVGFGWDSVHLNAQAGGEAYFYNSLGTGDVTNSSGNTYDYTGRKYKIAYHVDPIILASAGVTAKFDVGNLPDAFGLKLGFATNRVFKSGGDLQDSSPAHSLGVPGAFSDALDGALFLAGFRARVRIAHFTSGTVELIDALNGTGTVGSSPFSFSEKEIHLDYDFVPRDTPILKSATLGFGYFDYSLPRILYELVNVTPDQSNGNFVYNRETPPQDVRTRLYTLGLTFLFEQPATDNLTAFFSLNGSFGLGPMSYYFLKNENLPPDESNREHVSHTTTGFGANSGLGVRWRFVGDEGRLNAHFNLAYQAQLLSVIDLGTDKDKVVDSGSMDLFHGPTCTLGGSF